VFLEKQHISWLLTLVKSCSFRGRKRDGGGIVDKTPSMNLPESSGGKALQ